MFEYELLGETLDDACGEAFDKGAKKMNLNYPGGPEIENLAKNGNRDLIKFPRPMKNDNSFNFSFGTTTWNLIWTTCLPSKEIVSVKIKNNYTLVSNSINYFCSSYIF